MVHLFLQDILSPYITVANIPTGNAKNPQTISHAQPEHFM